MLVLHVRPFDLVADVPRRVMDTVRHGDFRPTARWNALSGNQPPPTHAKNPPSSAPNARARYEYAMDLFAVTAGYAALACLISMSTRRNRDGLDLTSIAWSGFVTVSLAGIVTALRILMVSHSLDTAHAVCGIVGWPFGVIVASLLHTAQKRERLRNAERSSMARRADDAFLGTMARWAPFFSVGGSIVGHCL